MADPTGLDFFTYPIRRFGWWLRTPAPSCNIVYCPRPRIGFSVYCRAHTDEVLRPRLIDGKDSSGRSADE